MVVVAGPGNVLDARPGSMNGGGEGGKAGGCGGEAESELKVDLKSTRTL